MSEMDSNVCWPGGSDSSHTEIMSQAQKQIFLFTVGYQKEPEGGEQSLKEISTIEKTLEAHKHILLQHVNDLPMSEESNQQINAEIELELSERNYPTLEQNIELDSANDNSSFVLSQDSQEVSINALDPAQYVLSQDQSEVSISSLDPNGYVLPQDSAEITVDSLNPNSYVLSQGSPEVTISSLDPASYVLSQDSTEITIDSLDQTSYEHQGSPEVTIDSLDATSYALSQNVEEVTINSLDSRSYALSQNPSEVTIDSLDPTTYVLPPDSVETVVNALDTDNYVLSQDSVEITVNSLDRNTYVLPQDSAEVTVNSLDSNSYVLSQDSTEVTVNSHETTSYVLPPDSMEVSTDVLDPCSYVLQQDSVDVSINALDPHRYILPPETSKAQVNALDPHSYILPQSSFEVSVIPIDSHKHDQPQESSKASVNALDPHSYVCSQDSRQSTVQGDDQKKYQPEDSSQEISYCSQTDKANKSGNTKIDSTEKTSLPDSTFYSKDDYNNIEACQIISDGSPEPRAKRTLPTDYLYFRKIHARGDMIGVFAKKLLPERTQFGPIKGVLNAGSRVEPPCSGLRLIILKDGGDKRSYLCVTNEELSNWMRYVRVAVKAQEQNLVVNQINDELHFFTTKVIKPNQELRVWYSDQYAAHRFLPLLTKGKERWKCSRCPFASVKSQAMSQHIATHRMESLMKAKQAKHEAKEKAKIVEEKKAKEITKRIVSIILQQRPEEPPQAGEEPASPPSHKSVKVTKNEETCEMCKKEFCPVHSSLTSSSPPHNNKEVPTETDSMEEDEADDVFQHGHVCKNCGRAFNNARALTLHYKSYDKNTFECPLCEKTFERSHDLKLHIAIHKIDGVFKCTFCNKECQTYIQVRKHINIAHKRKVECHICFKKLPTTDRLRLHLLSHSSEKQFLCAYCGKQLKRKDKLVEHIKMFHNQVPATPAVETPPKTVRAVDRFKCPECEAQFRKRGVLVNHIIKRHSALDLDSVPDLQQPIIKAQKDFLCQYCEKVYRSSSKRKEHIMKKHPGSEIPPSQMKHGEDAFTERVWSIEPEPYKCEFCSRQYTTRYKLLQHQRKAHLKLLPEKLRVASATTSKVMQDKKAAIRLAELKKMNSQKNIKDQSNKSVEKNMDQEPPILELGMEIVDHEGIFLTEGGLIVNGPTLKKLLRLGDSNAEGNVLSSDLERLLSQDRPDQYFKVVTEDGITIAKPVEPWNPRDELHQPTSEAD